MGRRSKNAYPSPVRKLNSPLQEERSSSTENDKTDQTNVTTGVASEHEKFTVKPVLPVSNLVGNVEVKCTRTTCISPQLPRVSIDPKGISVLPRATLAVKYLPSFKPSTEQKFHSQSGSNLSLTHPKNCATSKAMTYLVIPAGNVLVKSQCAVQAKQESSLPRVIAAKRKLDLNVPALNPSPLISAVGRYVRKEPDATAIQSKVMKCDPKASRLSQISFTDFLQQSNSDQVKSYNLLQQKIYCAQAGSTPQPSYIITASEPQAVPKPTVRTEQPTVIQSKCSAFQSRQAEIYRRPSSADIETQREMNAMDWGCSSSAQPKADASLTTTAKNFLDLLERAPKGELELNFVSRELKCAKRRLYDITNVLEGVGLLRKTTKNRVQWCANDIGSTSTMLKKLENENSDLDKYEKHLDELIESTQNSYGKEFDNQINRRFGYITHETAEDLNFGRDQMLIFVNGPRNTELTVHDASRLCLKSDSGPIEVFLHKKERQPTDDFVPIQENIVHTGVPPRASNATPVNYQQMGKISPIDDVSRDSGVDSPTRFSMASTGGGETSLTPEEPIFKFPSRISDNSFPSPDSFGRTAFTPVPSELPDYLFSLDDDLEGITDLFELE